MWCSSYPLPLMKRTPQVRPVGRLNDSRGVSSRYLVEIFVGLMYGSLVCKFLADRTPRGDQWVYIEKK